MSVTYRFSSMNSLADHCLITAQRLREKEPHGRNKKDREMIRISNAGEAIAWESIADMLRVTVIDRKNDL